MRGYFEARAGAYGDGLGFQDQEVIALRKMGYTGHLNDMRRSFYQTMTGDSFLMDAKHKAKSILPASYMKNYADKARGDGDSSRLIFYSGTGLSELTPSDMVNEPSSAYGGAALEDDGSQGYFSITSPTGAFVQFNFKFSLNEYGTRDEVLNVLKEIKFRIKSEECRIKVWNDLLGIYENEVISDSVSSFEEISVIGNLEECITDENEINFMAISPNKTDGTNTVEVRFDYCEMIPTFFKSM